MANTLIRRALAERLQSIGMCPDLANDQDAVKRVCEQFGFSRDEAARELVEMRAESGMSLLRNFGISVPPQEFLASLSTSRQVLSQSGQEAARDIIERFYDKHFSQDENTISTDLGDVKVPFAAQLREMVEHAANEHRRKRRHDDMGEILGEHEFDTEKP